MLRRMIFPPVLCAALVMAVFSGAFASAKPVDAKSTKSKDCIHYWNSASDEADFPCRIKGSYLAIYTYGTGRTGNLSKIKILCGPEHKTQYSDHVSGWVACTVHLAKGLKIAHVYVEHRYPMKNKSNFVAKKHGTYTFSTKLENPNYQVTSNYPTLWVEAVRTG
jgi:hypothetical protein